MAATMVLVIDDEERFGANLVKILGAHAITAKAVTSGENALAELAQVPYDVILLDMKMPGLSGTATLKKIREQECRAKVIVLTGHASVDDAVELINLGAYDYLLKPCATDKLLKMISLAFEQKQFDERPLG